MKPIFTTLPCKICEYALLNRKCNHLMLYLYLKHISSGHVKYNNDNYKIWAIDLGVSYRWLRDAIKWLIKNKWITVNTKKESLRIVGYDQLKKLLRIDSKSAFIYESDDITEFKKICCAVVITYHLRRKRWMDKKGWSGSFMVNSSKSHYLYPKGFYALPIRYLAKVLGVSASTANNFKKRAIESGYLEVRRCITTLTDSDGNKISKTNLRVFQKFNPKIAGRLRMGKKYLKIVDPDIIKSEILMIRKRSKY